MELLEQANEEFVPPLSHRSSSTQTDLESKDVNGSLQAYGTELLGQNLIGASDGFGTLVGLMSYRPDHLLPVPSPHLTCYVSTLIVRKNHRGHGLSELMYRELIPWADVARTPIATRTWTQNYSHLHILEKLGFTLICRIPNDRGEDVDTVYYERAVGKSVPR